MPGGQGKGTRGQGTGPGASGGRRRQDTGGPRGRGRRGPGAGFGGPGGYCICPKCGYKTLHKRGQECYLKKCPECGAYMIRERVTQAR